MRLVCQSLGGGSLDKELRIGDPAKKWAQLWSRGDFPNGVVRPQQMATVVTNFPDKVPETPALTGSCLVGREDCVIHDVTGRRTGRDVLLARSGGSDGPQPSTVAVLSYVALAWASILSRTVRRELALVLAHEEAIWKCFAWIIEIAHLSVSCAKCSVAHLWAHGGVILHTFTCIRQHLSDFEIVHSELSKDTISESLLAAANRFRRSQVRNACCGSPCTGRLVSVAPRVRWHPRYGGNRSPRESW